MASSDLGAMEEEPLQEVGEKWDGADADDQEADLEALTAALGSEEDWNACLMV